MRVALVHDWLTGMRGGEKVLDALAEMFPDARLLTLVHTRGRVSDTIERLGPKTSLVQRLPLASRLYRQYLPVFPFAVEQFDLDDVDLVVSTSHCAVKSVVVPGRARHLCYCHTPMRYAWDQFAWYFGRDVVGRLPNLALRPVMRRLARWDAATASRVDRFLANSQHVARRIGRYYRRKAAVVYPPVDTGFFCPDGRKPEGYFLIVSALVPYKRIDIAIEAARLAGRPLRIAGDGPEAGRLRARAAGAPVEFVGTVSDEALRDLYRGAEAVLLPGEEDLGIVPLEAQACGRPVVALARGGALETVRAGETGLLVEDGSPQAFAAALAAVADRFDPARARAHALGFGRERFLAEMRAAVAETMTGIGVDRW